MRILVFFLGVFRVMLFQSLMDSPRPEAAASCPANACHASAPALSAPATSATDTCTPALAPRAAPVAAAGTPGMTHRLRIRSQH